MVCCRVVSRTRKRRMLFHSALARPANRSPAHDGRAPGEAGAEAAEDNEVVWLDATLLHRLVEDQGNRARRGVAIAFEIIEHLAARNFQHIDGGVHNANIRLVW